MAYELAIELGAVRGPRYAQIARAIAADIRSGRLKPNARLPSTRKLALQLRVHRKTVVAAVDELEREGWVVRRQRSGVFIADDLPVTAVAARKPQYVRSHIDAARVRLPSRPQSPRAKYDLLGGLPSLESVPTLALARAYRRALTLDRKRALLDYGDPRGLLHLRETLAEWLAERRGVRVKTDEIMVIRGAQYALYLACRSLLVAGDTVACEAYCHPVVASLFQLLGLHVLPIPVDAHGMQVDALVKACKGHRVRAVYTTPHHQLPTSVTLVAARRLQLLALARQQRITILEDDYDHEFRYEGQPVLPLAYLDPSGSVLYIGTLSKTVAPGLRVAFVVGSRAIVDQMARYRAFVDHQGDQVLERAVAELIDDGEIDRHLRRMVRVYRERRDALCEALASHLPVLRFETPAGGMAVWAHAPGVDVDAWVARSLSKGVSIQAASHFALGDVPLDYMRIGFAMHRPAQLREAVGILASALPVRARLREVIVPSADSRPRAQRGHRREDQGASNE